MPTTNYGPAPLIPSWSTKILGQSFRFEHTDIMAIPTSFDEMYRGTAINSDNSVHWMWTVGAREVFHEGQTVYWDAMKERVEANLRSALRVELMQRFKHTYTRVYI